MKNTMLWVLLLSLLCVCPALAEGLYVKPVENLPDDFFLGMDVSSVLAEEASGVVYRDEKGESRDLFAILKENGINLIRVRVWNDPFDKEGHGYGGGNNDIAAAVEIGKRAAACGLPLLVDFHYSDFWADPSKQMVPKAWKDMEIEDKAQALYEYTLDCLNQLKEAGVEVAMVQIGNETNGKLCGEKIWMNIVHHLMKAGVRAVREVFPSALAAVHFANPEAAGNYLTYASKLAYYGLDYDVFGTSYYPYWHGTLDNLKAVLSEIQETYGKKTMVLETSYAYTLEDGDFSGNTIGEGGSYERFWPVTVQGQSNELRDVVEAVNAAGGIGVCWWEGAWVPVGRESYEANSLKWEQYGSGWASSYAGEYDPADAGKYYGGSACDNQALFDFEGKALPSLKTFSYLRTGHEVPLGPDAIPDTYVTFDVNEDVVLPETVDAVLNDGSSRALPVTWETAEIPARTAGTWEIRGTADGMEARLIVRVQNTNYLVNGDFEDDGNDSVWLADNFGGTEQLYIEEKKTDSLDGTKHYHFYSAGKDAVGFDLTQTVEGLAAGTYAFEVSIMGGDAGAYETYAFLSVNGERVSKADLTITSWNNWDSAVCEAEIQEGDLVTVGVHVVCQGAGAWGKIDGASLSRVK